MRRAHSPGSAVPASDPGKPTSTLRWYDFITINVYWLGINVASGIITPILLPHLVAQYSPSELKNTYLATIRVITLLVAMGAQPIMGMLSDRSTHPAGRRRPFIVGGTIFNIIFLALVATSPMFQDAPSDGFFWSTFRVTTAFMVLLVAISLLQISSNTAHGALQGLIPDLIPENQRGRASGVKSLMELLPTFGIILVGPLVDSGRVWVTAGIMMAAFFVCMVIVVFTVREQPLTTKPSDSVIGPVLRILALVAIFGSVRWLAVWTLQLVANRIAEFGLSLQLQVALVGLSALVAIAAAIFVGVYLGAWVGIGSQARKQRTFIWWVINRLMFLAGIGSIQGFAQYYLGDVVGVENPATMTTVLLASVAVFLVSSALLGGYLSDRWGRKVLVAAAGLIAAAGTCLLLFSKGMTMVMISGFIIGTGAGTFLATNWALGTDLVPKNESGKYLGISNLAGAGAGIVGVGISGPLADFFNAVQPGMGYLVVFAVFAAMFALSSLTLVQVKLPRSQSASA